ncbi:hypothetical protein GCM10025865_16020 [Paraoerskovia sediminicola]|uniref:Mannosidase Ig/CBM-like domain-containing protein n=1 Tax=Paraoerskovia sediminicola TaxID=1138587 RepID=A0ABM8G2G9_9CELL|nr:hypothetical protein [Paraoerskovia sediminicola]BDZ42303.1 hypothetical protein GCM10025865_16020 [Paraoerskovia sediminicola]
MAPHLPDPVDTADWHYLTQLNQARAITFGVEHYRGLWPHCMGAILWQLNDCWPVTSWAAVDGAGRQKPLWYALRRLYADRIVLLRRSGAGELEVVVVNDGPHRWTAPLDLTRRSLDGQVLATVSSTVDVAPRSSTVVRVPDDVATPMDAAREAVSASVDGQRTLHLFVEDRDLEMGRARLDVTARPIEDGVAVMVVARSFARDLVLNSDRVDPESVVDDQLVTLFPGESHEFRVCTRTTADDPRWTTPPVLRCVNDTARERSSVAV